MENIIILITKLNGGGAERCASNLSIELNKKYNVLLVAFDASNMTYPYGGTLYDLQIGAEPSGLRKIINIWKRIHALRKIKKEQNVACTISLLDGPNLINVLSKRKDKTVVSVRNWLSGEKPGMLRRKIITYVSKKADMTVALSNVVRDDLIENFQIPGQRITTIYNHCDKNLLNLLSKENYDNLGMDANIFHYITMGRLNYQKGQWHLLRAFKRVSEKIHNVKLIILGEGELKENLQLLSNDLGISDKVYFAGYIKNPHNILKKCDVFVLPSLFEGLGNVLLEALSFGMPIISSDCLAGPREILAPESDRHDSAVDVEYASCGVLVPVCDGKHFNAEEGLTNEEEILAKAMIELYEKEDIRNLYSIKAEKRINDFDKEKIINKWANLINDLIE